MLEPSSLPFASIAICCWGVQACRLPAFKCVKCSAAASTSLQTPKMLRGSFDQALWPLRPAFKPLKCFAAAVCQPSNASNALRPPLRPAFKPPKSFAAALTRHSGHRHLLLEPSVVRAFKPAVCQPSNASTSLQTPKILRGSFDQ